MRKLSPMFGQFHKKVWKTIPLVATLGVLAGCATPIQITTPVVPQIAPLDPQALPIAETAVNEGRYGDAKQILQRVFGSDPGNLHGKLLLAEIILATGTPAAALAQFDEIATEKKFAGRALQGKGLSYFKLMKMSEGQKFLKLAIENDPTLWRALNALGYYYDSTQSWPEASGAYDQAIKHRPTMAMLHNNRGFSRLLQKRFPEAIRDIQTAIRLQPDLVVARLNLQLALAWKGDYARATLGADKNKKGEALNNIGYIALLRGDLTVAEAHFLRALEADAAYNKTAHQNLSYLRELKEIQEIEKVELSKNTTSQ